MSGSVSSSQWAVVKMRLMISVTFMWVCIKKQYDVFTKQTVAFFMCNLCSLVFWLISYVMTETWMMTKMRKEDIGHLKVFSWLIDKSVNNTCALCLCLLSRLVRNNPLHDNKHICLAFFKFHNNSLSFSNFLSCSWNVIWSVDFLQKLYVQYTFNICWSSELMSEGQNRSTLAWVWQRKGWKYENTLPKSSCDLPGGHILLACHTTVLDYFHESNPTALSGIRENMWCACRERGKKKKKKRKLIPGEDSLMVDGIDRNKSVCVRTSWCLA